MNASGRQFGSQLHYSSVGGWSTAPQIQPQNTYQQSANHFSQPGQQIQAFQQHQQQQQQQHHHQVVANAVAPYPYVTAPAVTHQPPPQHHPTVVTPSVELTLENSENYETSVYVGMEDAPSEFRLAFRVIGEKGQNLEYLSRTTGAKVILRGRGTGIFNQKPLHIYVGHSTLEGKEEAESLANNLVRAVKEEYADWRKKNGFPVDRSTSTTQRDRQATVQKHDRDDRKPNHSDLRIPRDQGRTDGPREEIRLGRVEVRQEDSRRVVQMPRSESALNRLGPRVAEPAIREQQNSLPQDNYGQGRSGLPRGRRSRSRSRSPIRRSNDGIFVSPPHRGGDPGNRQVHVRLDPHDLRSKISGDRDTKVMERVKEPPSNEQPRRETLTIIAHQDKRAIRSDNHETRPNERDQRVDERRDGRPNENPSIRRGEWRDDKRNDIKDDGYRHRPEERRDDRHAERGIERRDDRDHRREERRESPRRSDRWHNANNSENRHRLPHCREDNIKKQLPPKNEGFGMAAQVSKQIQNKLVPTAAKKRPAPKFFVPGMHGEALEMVLDQQDMRKLTPIFVVRNNGQEKTKNYIWVVGDTAAYLAAQRAAEHPDGPNLGIPRTMILWFGCPGMKITRVVDFLKTKLDRNNSPDAVIMHVGGEDLVNYLDMDRQLDRDMTDMIANTKKLLPHTHLSWSNVLPWKRYPSKESQYKLENLRLKMNENAKRLMKLHKGSTLYHDHDFIARKDMVNVYHRRGFYPSDEGAKCMVFNFGTIIRDLVS